MTDTGDLAERRKRAVDALVKLVRGVGDAVLEEIAYGDSQAQAGHPEKHLAALREVVDDYDCRLNRRPNSSWFPSEPVELVSYGVNGDSLPAICACNALLMISDLEGGDFGYMDYRWTEKPGEDWFKGLPELYRGPLLDGMDVILEDWRCEGCI